MHTASVGNGLVVASVFWQDSRSRHDPLNYGKTGMSAAGLACYGCRRRLAHLSDNCRTLMRHGRVHKVGVDWEQKGARWFKGRIAALHVDYEV